MVQDLQPFSEDEHGKRVKALLACCVYGVEPLSGEMDPVAAAREALSRDSSVNSPSLLSRVHKELFGPFKAVLDARCTPKFGHAQLAGFQEAYNTEMPRILAAILQSAHPEIRSDLERTLPVALEAAKMVVTSSYFISGEDAVEKALNNRQSRGR